MTELATNVLSYGDNLDILRRYLPDASVDLISLDPPFNANRDSNVIFRHESGNPTDAQLLACADTWHWDLSRRRDVPTPEDWSATGQRQPGLSTISATIASRADVPVAIRSVARRRSTRACASASHAGGPTSSSRVPTSR